MENTGVIQKYEKGGTRVVQEYFSSIHQMLSCFSSRENNSVMRNEHSSSGHEDSDWAGTRTYEEAERLITCGYTDILGKLSLGIKKVMKSLKDYDFSKSYMVEDVQGVCPIIPNYLLGLPKTMSYRQPVAKKIKTINIIYAPTSNCYTDPDEFIEAGIPVLSAIRAIEKNNISVKLDCMFMDTVTSNEAAIGIVKVKNYRDRLDLQKLCFTIAHPAMLRRFGFKFLETVPGITDSNFTFGYGRTPDLNELKKFFDLPKDTVLLNFELVNGELKCDPKKVIDYINEAVRNKQ